MTNLTPRKKRATEQQQAKFLELLSKSCNVTLSAHGAGVTRAAAYLWRNDNPDFAAAWDDAIAQAIELLEAEAWNRARKTSDTLMIFLLKAHNPAKYRETFHYKGEVAVFDWREEVRRQGLDPDALMEEFKSYMLQAAESTRAE